MKLKEYIKQIEAHIKPDTTHPKEIIQLLACLIGQRLSCSNKLPVACGKGEGLDMDIVQAGIVAGLERLPAYDPKLGDMRQFLYPTIAYTMLEYAWKRENPVADSRSATWFPISMPINDGTYEAGADGAEGGDGVAEGFAADGWGRGVALVDPHTPDSIISDLEQADIRARGAKRAFRALGAESTALLERDAAIGYNAAARQAWADEIGVSVGALSMRLARLRRDARDWALSVH